MTKTSGQIFSDIEKQKLEIAIREQNLKLLKAREEESKTNSRIRKLLDEYAELKKGNEDLLKAREATTKGVALVNKELNKVKKELASFTASLESKREELRQEEEDIIKERKINSEREDYLNTLKKDLDASTTSLELRIKKSEDLAKKANKEKLEAEKRLREATAKESAVASREDRFSNAIASVNKQQEDIKVKEALMRKDKEAIDSEKNYLAKCSSEIEKEQASIINKKVKLDRSIADYEEQKRVMEQKQASLDNNIEELKNDEGRIEVTRLKVVKLINDNKSISELGKLKAELLK